MAIWTSFRRLFGSGGVSNPDHGYQLGAIEKTYTEAGISVTDERALKVSAVWACTQLIANSVAGLPLNVFRESETGRMPMKSRHYLTDLLHVAPNSLMKPEEDWAAAGVGPAPSWARRSTSAAEVRVLEMMVMASVL